MEFGWVGYRQCALKLHGAVQTDLALFIEILAAPGERAECGFIDGEAALGALALDPLDKLFSLRSTAYATPVLGQSAVGQFLGNFLGRIGAELKGVPLRDEVCFRDWFCLPAFLRPPDTTRAAPAARVKRSGAGSLRGAGPNALESSRRSPSWPGNAFQTAWCQS